MFAKFRIKQKKIKENEIKENVPKMMSWRR